MDNPNKQERNKWCSGLVSCLRRVHDLKNITPGNKLGAPVWRPAPGGSKNSKNKLDETPKKTYNCPFVKIVCSGTALPRGGVCSSKHDPSFNTARQGVALPRRHSRGRRC